MGEVAQQRQATTTYVVLGSYENDWTVVGTFDARSGNDAIRAALSDGGQLVPPRIASTDTFVAVPSRSWAPVKVSKKVETTLRIEAVGPHD
jgi:hypothetical protein